MRSPEGSTVHCTPQMRHLLIVKAAYFRAERRGFAPGRELEDWLDAEAELDRVLNLGWLKS
jgi:hypothetical protein